MLLLELEFDKTVAFGFYREKSETRSQKGASSDNRISVSKRALHTLQTEMDLTDKNFSPKKLPDRKKRLAKGCTTLMYSCQQGKI